MAKNNIEPALQERIIQSITSFALYGFPESHAASFALIAYASAYLKCHYLAAFTVCILNNQPMGFYSPATLVKDAQRHGQRFRPVDVCRSEVNCTIENDREVKYVRLGLNYVKGLKAQTAQAIIRAREKEAFQSIRDLVRRVPQLNQRDLVRLSELGALNGLPENEHDRRGALWHATAAIRPVGELLECAANDPDGSPLSPMTPEQRIHSDFARSGLSIGKHPMSFYREDLRAAGILSAAAAKAQRNGEVVRVAGAVITRQRPGTAKGFVFLSLEDETGIVNVIVSPDLFDRQKEACVTAAYVCIKGTVQNTWNVVSVKAADIQALPYGGKEMPSHNFH